MYVSNGWLKLHFHACLFRLITFPHRAAAGFRGNNVLGDLQRPGGEAPVLRGSEMSLPLQEQHDTHLQMPQEKTELVIERESDESRDVNS